MYLGSCALQLACVAPLIAQPAVTGQLIGTNDEPLSGARVELSPIPTNYEAGRLRLEGRGLPPSLAATESDELGRFVLRAPHAGVWRVVARATGRVPMQYGPILLLEPEELPPVRLDPDVGSRVEVLREDGRPVPGAWVVGTAESDGAGGRASGGWQPDFKVELTAPDGSLILPRFAEERLKLTVHALNRVEESRSVSAQSNIRLPVADQETISLRVVTPEGEAVGEVLVRSGLTLWPVGLTGANGRLRLPVRRGEAARILLVAPDGGQHVVAAGAAGAGEETTVTLPPPVRVRGRLLDARSGRGIAGAALWLSTDPAVVVRTDGHGGYDLVVPAGWRLSLVARAVGFLPKRHTLSAAELAEGRVPTLALEPAAQLAGAVLAPDGKPVVGATVEAVHSSNLAPRTFSSRDPVSDRAATGHDGRFALRQLRTSEAYELRVTKRGFFPAAREIVALGADSRRAPLQVRLRTTCGLHGVLRDPQDRALVGAKVLVRPAARVEPTGRRSESPEHESTDTVAAASDGAGRFAIEIPPADEVDFEVRKQGFAPTVRRSVRIEPGCRGSFDLGTLVLQPGVRLAGQVVNQRGQALSGAEVFLVDRLPPRIAWAATLRDRRPDVATDRAGRFVLKDLPAGVAQHLLVRAPRYLVAAVRGVRPPPPEPLLVELDPAVSLRGRLVDARQTGVSGAPVDLYWQRTLPGDPRKRPVGDLIRRSVVSDGEGRFEIEEVPEGEVSLHVTARGFVPVHEEVRLPSADADDEVVLVLERGARLEGRVMTDRGDPVSAARVSVGEHTVVSDAEGVYALDGIALGEEELLVFHPDYPRLLRPVRIEDGVNHLDVELDAGVEVTGRVIDADGQPVIASEVALTPGGRPGLRLYDTRTGEDGRFVLRPVAAGRYRLEARTADAVSGELPDPLVVSDAPIHGIEVVLRAGATVDGWILGLSAEELPHVLVSAFGAMGDSRPAKLDSEGRFEVRNLPPGDWLLRASLREGQRQVEARLPIAPADRRLRLDLEFDGRLTVTGRVTLGAEPLSASRVSMRGERFSTERSVLTAFDGSFVIQDLEPDVYWLGVKDPNQLLVHNQTLELTQDVDVEIAIEVASIAGVVTDEATGAAIADALLSLRPLEGPSFLVTDATQADGTFRLFNVPPKTYRFTATARGYSPAEHQISVAPGDEIEHFQIELSRTEGLEIEVRLSSGETPALFHLLARDGAGAPVLAASFAAGPSGRAEISSLPPGEWRLSVGASGGATTTRWVKVPGEPVLITLPPAGDVHVQIPALARENVLATVRLLQPEQEPLWTLGPGGSVEQTWILRGGKGTVAGVPSGAWSVIAETADGRAWVGSVVTAGAGQATVSLE